MLKTINSDDILVNFPKIELSYETMAHNKVYDSDVILAIPEGPKMFAWFTEYNDEPVCFICSNPKRNPAIICVVEDIRDVMAIESTGTFKGLYHVLGGLISPMDGIGPQDLNILPLQERLSKQEVSEVIFALSPTMEGDTTNFYIFKRLKDLTIKTSTIARGIAVGDELEYADEVTLGRSIINRVPFENSLKIT
jgi:recombination protein RecR